MPCFSVRSVINGTDRNNSSTWLPHRRYTWEIRKLFYPHVQLPNMKMVLFIAGRIRRDLLFLRLTGAARVWPNFSFFCSPEEIKSASLCNWGHKYCLCRPEDTWQGEESSIVFFSGFFQVSVKATHMLTYKKGNLYFFQSLCFLCVYCCSSVFLRYKQGWGGGGGGGGGGYTWLIIALCVRNTIASAIATKLAAN